MTLPLFLLGAWAFAGQIGQLAAQEVITDELQCSTCRLNVRVVARFGDVDGPGALPGPASSVVVDEEGRYWATFASEILPMVFSRDGQFVGEAGSLGEGPGEFIRPQVAALAGDSVAVYDPLSQRVILIGPDRRYVREIAVRDLQVQGMLVLDWPGTVVMNGMGRSAETVGWLLFVTDLSGAQASVTGSLGLDGGAFNSPFSRFYKQNLERSRAGGLWAVPRWNDYRMVRWSATGSILDHFVRDAAWLPPGSDGLSGGPQTPPTPYVVALHEDSGGLLWIMGHVPRPDWRRPYAEIRARQGDPPPTSGAVSETPDSFYPMPWELYETMVEVVDPVNRRVIWRETLSAWLVDVLEDGRLILYGETLEHIPYMEVVAVTLDGGQ